MSTPTTAVAQKRHSPLRRVKRAWVDMKPFLAASKGRVIVLVIAAIAEGFIEAAVLFVLVQLALAISDGHHSVAVNVGPIHHALSIAGLFATAVALSILRFVLQWLTSRLPAKMSADAQSKLRRDTVKAFVEASWSVQSREREGQLQDILTGQIGRAASAVLYVVDGMTSLFNFMALIASAIIVNPVAAFTIVVAVIVLFFTLRPITLVARRFSAQKAKADLRYAEAVSELVRMTEEIKVFGAGERQRTKMDKLIDDVAQPYYRTSMLSQLVPAIYQTAAIVLVVVGLFFMYQFESNRVAALGAVVLILIRALSYSGSLQTVYHRMNDLIPYMDRVRRKREEYETTRDVYGDGTISRIDRLSFDRVSYAYVPGRPVLKDVSFEIRAGEAVGIIGPSGAGKSTLVQLLLRLRSPVTGQMLLNGIDAADFDLHDWRRHVAYVPQDSRVLSASVGDNIRFFRDIDDETVAKAARMAYIERDILSWDKQYDTQVGQRADAVSGGQRQRICLARALAAEPDLLILDEPTSALDVHSEAAVQESLTLLKGRVTLLIVAHRLSTLNICDRIMVFEDGELQAFGPPDELLSSSSFYREAVELSRLP